MSICAFERRNAFAGALLSLAVLLVLFSVIAFSGESEADSSNSFEVGGIIYNLQVGGATVSVAGCTDQDAESVDIPSSVTNTADGKTYSVTRINAEAFRGMSNLVSALIPESVDSIGTYVFADCPNLTTAYVHVETLSDGLYLNCTSLESLPFGDSVTVICKEAFKGCTGLKDIVIPCNVRFIDEEAFSGCTGMTTLDFAGSSALKKIGYGAFKNCTELYHVNLPENLTSILDKAFSGCSALTTININNISFTDQMVEKDSFALGNSKVWVNCPSSDYHSVDYHSAGFGTITVYLNKQEFTVTFEGCGKSPVTKNYHAGDSIAYVPEKDGYDFAGWSPSITVMPASDITLTAQWVVKKYTITYDPNSGYGTMDTQQYEYDYPTDLKANGFGSDTGKYVCWSLDPKDDGSNPVKNTKELSKSNEGDVTVYAVWRNADYIVSFDGNGASGSMHSQPYDAGEESALTANAFTKTGYTFDHWTDGTTSYSDKEVCSFTDSKTLTAVWSANKYSVVFNCNGATTMSDYFSHEQVLTYDTSEDLSGYSVSRTGYNFQYWVNTADQSVHYTDSILNAATGGTVTLTAVWNPVSYTVIFHDKADGSDTYAEIGSQVLTYNRAAELDECTAYHHYKYCAGWSTAEGGEAVYGDRESVVNLADRETYVHLYAVWADRTYVVVYDPNEASPGFTKVDTVCMKDDYTIAECPYTYEGHDFVDYLVRYADGTTENMHPGDVVSNVPESRVQLVLIAEWKESGGDDPDPSGDRGSNNVLLWAGLAAVVIVSLMVGAVYMVRRP